MIYLENTHINMQCETDKKVTTVYTKDYVNSFHLQKMQSKNITMNLL